MAIVVRPLAAESRAAWTTRSEVLSRAEVASSKSLGEVSLGWIEMVIRHRNRKSEDLQNLRVADQSAGDGYTLFLTTREHDAFGADDCVETIW